MNDIVAMTEDELVKAVNEVDERKRFLDSKQGAVRAAERMTVIFAALEGYGYRIGTEQIATKARLWVDALSDEIALFGFEAIEDAVKSFVRNDRRNYKSFPTPGDIILECRKTGRNPKAELARREAKRTEEALEAKWRAECKAEKTPEEVEAWLQKIRERGKKCLQ